MAAKEKKQFGAPTIQNRRARFDYEVKETFEAGILLTGSEVKSLRLGSASIAEAYAIDRGGELFLVNANISPYTAANRFNHAPTRERKLLLRTREIDKILGLIKRQRMTLIPLALEFNPKGRVKCTLGLALGKKKHDKRETEKNRDWQREKGRLLRRED